MTFKLPEVPKFADMHVAEMSKDQLQAALVQLIGLHNKLENAVHDMVRNGQILSPRQASSNTTYGL
jgi:hypothetical protein